MIRTLSPETTLENLLLNGSINQRMATAITAAFIETYGFAETPKPLRLADMEKSRAVFCCVSPISACAQPSNCLRYVPKPG